MEVLAWIATLLSIIGIILNAKKHISCWSVWLVSNVLWIIYFINIWNLQSLILWIVFGIFNVYGWIQWKKDKISLEKVMDVVYDDTPDFDENPTYGDEEKL